MKLRPGWTAAIAALCITAGAVRAQYVEDSILVAGSWVGGLAYNNREDVIYGVSESAHWLFAVSCERDSVVAGFAIGRPFDICYDSLDNKAYCTLIREDSEWLGVIDGQTHSLVKLIPMAGSTVPVWDPVSDRVYVSCASTNSVAVVDCATDSLLCYIPVGQWPFEMYVNTLWRKLYVLNYDGGSVSVVDIATNQVTRTVAVGEPYAGYYCGRVDKFYCGVNQEVVVLDGRGDTVVARIPVAPSHDVGAISGSDTRDVVVAAASDMDTRFYAINAATDAIDTIILAGDWCEAIYWSPLSDRFFCISDFTNEVIVLSGDGRQLLMTLPVGKDPYVFAASPVQRRLYVGHLGCHYVYVLRDTATGAIAEPQSPHPGARGFIVTPNPFRRNAAVVWNTPARGREVARLYAQDGRLVRQALIPAGEARWVWDGRDDSGALLPPGVYVIEAGPSLCAKVVKLR